MRTLPDHVPRLTKAELAVFISGVASMGLEILAGRIVAPQFGSSIYTWGSIIGVFLAALSLGYHQGGKRAERATNREMTWLFIATAAYVAVLLFARDPLLTATATINLPPRYASLPAIIIMFGPPTYFLGFISPYAAQLSQKEGIGEASGHVYALGTIGSIVGTFATTFLLIPSLSIGQIGLVFGLLLVVTAVGLELPSPSRKPTIGAFFVVILLVGAVAGGTAGYSVQGEVLHQTQTPYQQLTVADSGDTRTMYLDGKRHSAMDLESPNRHVFDYTRYFHMPYLFHDEPDEIDRVLFVGGGGFTGPKRFVEEYDATVDVVEIDPDVIDAAETYFDVEESDQLNIYNQDGRVFLQETNHTYDAIVLDAYKMDKVPHELTTEEFMSEVDDRLNDDGVLVANVISAPSGPASDFYRAEYKTMERVFPQVYAFRTSSASVVQNIELVATKDDDRLTEADLEARNDERDIGIDLSDEVGTYVESTATDDVPVLRDDRGSVDSLLDPMLGQRYVIEESGSDAGSDAETTNETRNRSVSPIEPDPRSGSGTDPGLGPESAPAVAAD
ncbi:spermidine synthase [Halomontanus rarus]|uniref:spermidine synthase n=1 Tax=Halomontanus rarus TaxID=3034020 RepID=UPI0023E77478|nr:fused MFS/spermidine synthase [Halovivax sp. TS33]